MCRVDQSATGYGSTSDQHELVREAFYPDVGHLFPGAWPYSMVVTLAPNGTLPPHKDGPLKTGCQRYHLVLQTNENVWQLHDGDWQQLEAGGIYELDQTKIHAAVNWGDKARVHLVMDVMA